MRILTLFATLALLTAATPRAHAQATPPATPTAPAANPADVESIDAIMAAIYDVISGPAGQPRNWDRFRSLMAPNARLIPTGRSREGRATYRALTPDEYVANAGAMLERDGFFEREIGRKLERYGNIVHLMSAYEARRTLADAQPFLRGVNSFQLWFDGTRWYVVTIFWEAETPGNPVPSEWIRERP
jgi:hypothetical protein